MCALRTLQPFSDARAGSGREAHLRQSRWHSRVQTGLQGLEPLQRLRAACTGGQVGLYGLTLDVAHLAVEVCE